jgi:Response regulator containing a CheY-like receiver domain and an HTH DNA-binding domain
MKVLLVDDHILFLEGLTSLLTANGIEVAGTASSGPAALLQAEKLQPDVILMDICMPQGDGIEATRAIKSRFPGIKIVMLTVAQDNTHLFEAIKAGASGYLLKGLPKENFLASLAGLARGEAPLSPILATKLLAEFSQLEQKVAAIETVAAQTASLSTRQLDILKLAAKGYTYKEIGQHFCLAESTIKYHMGEITNRLHLKNRSQVLAFTASLNLGAEASAPQKKYF